MPDLLIAAAILACPLPVDESVIFSRKTELPHGAVEAFGRLAEKGEPFQATDFIIVADEEQGAAEPGLITRFLTIGRRFEMRSTLPSARFLAAQGRGCEITLEYEQGGIAVFHRTAQFMFENGQWTLLSRR